MEGDLRWHGVTPTVGESAGEVGDAQSYKARLPDGRPAVAFTTRFRRTADAQTAAQRLSALCDAKPAHLAPVMAWAIDGTHVWFLNDGAFVEPLSALVQKSSLTIPQAIAVGRGVLEGLAGLHGLGLAHGALWLDSVTVGNGGEIRLRGHELRSSAGTEKEMAADLKQAGTIICATLGIDPRHRPMAEVRPAEAQVPALCVTARALAAGSMGGNAALALTDFVDTAGLLAGHDRVAQSTAELGALVGGIDHVAPPRRSAPPAEAPTPPLPRKHAAAALLPGSETQTVDTGRAIAIGIGVGFGLLVILAVGALVFGPLLNRSTPQHLAPVTSSSSPSPSAASSASASPTPSPATSQVKDVSIRVDGPCTAGSTCRIEITINLLQATTASEDVFWTFKVTDLCANTSSQQDGKHGTIAQGWAQYIDDSTISLPSSKALQVVATTSEIGTVSSSPLSIGSASC